MSIKNTILDNYQINIDEINLIKLYKIESADIKTEELEKKLAATRKKWVQGANSPNETIASRDKARLAKADVFEEILRNKEYLKALYDYYNNGGADNSASEFAKEFFTSLKGVNKSISQKDFNFFMQYFSEERKNEKAILEMLKKEFHAVTLKNASREDEEEQAEKSRKTGIAQTRFHKDSICLLHKIETQYAAMQKSPFLQRKYPELNRPLFDFLAVESKSATEFLMYVDGAVQEVFNARQNDSANSNEYIPLSEFYNNWKDLLKRPDAAENFYAFKMLIQYPKLTPYLYLAENVDIAFLEMLVKMVRSEYGFGGLDDFLFRYFKPLADGKHYSFTLDKKLEAKLKKVDKNPEAEEREAQRRGAAAKRRKMIPLPLQLLRLLATWPVCLVQLLFEAFRFMVVNIQHLIWVVMLFLTVAWGHFPSASLFSGIGYVITNFRELVEDVVYSVANTYSFNNIAFIFGGLCVIAEFAYTYLLLPALVTQFLYLFVRELDRSVDLMGFHKTFQNIQQSIEQKILYHYKKMGNRLYKKMVFPIVANILTTIAVIVLLLIIISLINFLASSTLL